MRKNTIREVINRESFLTESGTPMELFLDFLFSNDRELGAQACIDRDTKKGDFRTLSQVPSYSCLLYVVKTLYSMNKRKSISIDAIREKVKNTCGQHFLGCFDTFCTSKGNSPTEQPNEQSDTGSAAV